MTSLDTEVIRKQHEAWLAKPDTSRGQRADSTTILALLSEIDRLRTQIEDENSTRYKYKAICLERSVEELIAEKDAYYKALDKIISECSPSPRGNFKRGLGSCVLNIAFDAVGYRDRQMIAVIDGDGGDGK